MARADIYANFKHQERTLAKRLARLQSAPLKKVSLANWPNMLANLASLCQVYKPAKPSLKQVWQG